MFMSKNFYKQIIKLSQEINIKYAWLNKWNILKVIFKNNVSHMVVANKNQQY